MDLDLSDDQEFVRETTRKFLEAESPVSRARQLIDDPAGYDPGAWAQGAELGWFSMLVPEAHGGGSVSGQGVTDLAIIAEELGRVLFPGPVLPTNVVADAIARAGSPAQRAEHLPAIVRGEARATWAFAEANDLWDVDGVELEAIAGADGYVLRGTKSMVQDAHVADLLLVTARTPGGLTQLLVDPATAGITVVPLQALDLTRRFAEVHFDGVRVPAGAVLGDVGGGADQVERQLTLAVALQCAETVGATDRTFEFTLQYAKDRKAFGRPIGSFQALKHRFADMVLWLESSKAAAVAAAKAVQHGVDAAETTAVAKSYIGEHTPAIARDCLQLHGGIGFTWEHDLHLFLRRIESNRALFGDPDHHLDTLAGIVGL